MILDVLPEINNLLEEAYKIGASDIHIDPYDSFFVVRFRIDGLLEKRYEIREYALNEMVGKVKVLAGLRIDIHDRSQDGRFSIRLIGAQVHVRVSIVPTYYGENIVLRLLEQQGQKPKTFLELGMSDAHSKLISDAISKPQGLILIAGPTGSGKTTTLYSIIHQILSENNSILTLEEPVEYAIPGIRQIQIKQDRGFTFNSALKSILRQDPDVIMIGEIRDRETAQIAIQTALTGHLIISSIHAPDSITIIPRLIDMGIEPYLLSATISLLISQRLVRKITESNTYQGRIGVFEMMDVSELMKKSILQKPSIKELKTISMEDGMVSMMADGLEKVKSGITSLEEVMRVIHD